MRAALHRNSKRRLAGNDSFAKDTAILNLDPQKPWCAAGTPTRAEFYSFLLYSYESDLAYEQTVETDERMLAIIQNRAAQARELSVDIMTSSAIFDEMG